MTNIIYETVFGSRLFGTDLPTSDYDYKGIFVPDHRQIVLGKYPAVINTSTGDPKAKNTAEDRDEELFSLKEYLKHLENGQTNALDILFSTNRADPNINPFWAELYDNRNMVLSRKADSFVGYCIAQSNKYNFKIDRFNSLERAVKELEGYEAAGGGKETLQGFDLFFACAGDPNSYIEDIVISEVSGKTLAHVNVCGKKVPVTHTVDAALKVYNRLYQEYGHRAKNKDHDWKSVYHAIRIAEECIELLETGTITLPRPNAEYLKSVRRGEYSYEETSDKIVGLVAKIDSINSTLPEEPNRKWIEDYLYRVHLHYLYV